MARAQLACGLRPVPAGTRWLLLLGTGLWAAASPGPSKADGWEDATVDGVDESADSTDDMISHFITMQKAKAAEAFEELYGDGMGLDGEEPPLRETFLENYLVEALNRETKRILAEKGYAAKSEPGKRPFTDVEKKDAPVTLEGEIERLAVQKRQRRAIRERVHVDKAVEVLELDSADAKSQGHRFWEVSCGESLYRKHVYNVIPGCTPGPRPGLPCGRLVIDSFMTEAERAEMLRMTDRSLEGLFHQGEETLLVPEADSEKRMGEPGFQLTCKLLERAKAAVAQRLNISQIYYSGSLLKRMDHPPFTDEMQIDPGHDSSNPHVDKANIASYDWSCLLYLNSVGREFGGGELVFNDPGMDRLVQPMAGRLVAFSSGLENLHRVLPMRWGRRYVLSMWFTCSEHHAHLKLGAVTPNTAASTGTERRGAAEAAGVLVKDEF